MLLSPDADPVFAGHEKPEQAYQCEQSEDSKKVVKQADVISTLVEKLVVVAGLILVLKILK